jgi:hypothetical protein
VIEVPDRKRIVTHLLRDIGAFAIAEIILDELVDSLRTEILPGRR